jgi:hypothetical protein
MASAPTRPQLENGAHGISYRAEQLAGVVGLYVPAGPRVFVRAADRDYLTMVNSALVESALVNARALAWFFFGQSDKYVNAAMFSPQWHDDVSTIGRKIIGPIARHLNHSSLGEEGGEKHPGEWPLPELAVILVGGLARFVQSLRATSRGSEGGWFDPSPIETYDKLMAVRPLSKPTPESKNRSVAHLTRALQQYLGTPPRTQ